MGYFIHNTSPPDSSYSVKLVWDRINGEQEEERQKDKDTTKMKISSVDVGEKINPFSLFRRFFPVHQNIYASNN
jgi:hypothetical protein